MWKVHGNIGNVYAYLGDYAKSNEYTYRAMAIAQHLASENLLVTCLINLGDNYYHLGIYDSARVFGEKGYSMALKIKADISAGLALSNLGDAYNATGAPEIAIGYYRKGTFWAYWVCCCYSSLSISLSTHFLGAGRIIRLR